MDAARVRNRVEAGDAAITVAPLVIEDLHLIAWSGDVLHLENVAAQLDRVALGDVDYLALRVDDVLASKGGIDYAVEPGAGTIWQLATHPDLEGVGLGARLIAACEALIVARGLTRVRLAVEVENVRARQLYERLGYTGCGETPEEWEAQDEQGRTFMYRTTCLQMVKHL